MPPKNENPINPTEAGRAYPPGYYFDQESTDATAELPKSVAAETSSEISTEAPVEASANTSENLETSPSSAAEIAGQRREALGNFFKNSKDALLTKASSVGSGIMNFFGKARNAAINVAIAPDAYISAGYEKAGDFYVQKTNQLESFVQKKVAVAEAKAKFAKDKTVESVTSLKDSVVDQYESLKQFGVDTIEAGRLKTREIKSGFRTRKNNFIIAILRAIEERHREKANNVAATIALLQTI